MLPPIASNFIAGKTNQKVKKIGEKLYQSHNIVPIVNLLGEHYEDSHKVRSTKTQYIELINIFSQSPAQFEISIKPTQVGSEIEYDNLYKNLKQITESAIKNDIFVWIDMEDQNHIVNTLKCYHELSMKYPESIGICLQANLKRTKEDLRIISRIEGSSVRIVKGAYSSQDVDTYETKEMVDDNMVDVINYALDNIDHRVAVGSHDDSIIENFTGDNYNNKLEIQMLKGVREDYQRELADDYEVHQYMPFGKEWKSYTYRRIRERPRNIFLIARNLI